MLTIYIRRLMGVTTVTDAWSSVRPEKSFFGITVDQFKEAVKPCYAIREEIAETQKRLKSLMAQCKDADTSALKLTKNIVHAVKADPINIRIDSADPSPVVRDPRSRFATQ